MANTKTTIELNGTVYDAVTGTAVGGAAPKASKPVDGFVKPAGQPTPAVMQPKATTEPLTVAPKPTRESTISVNPAPARQPERSKTLMRHTLDKPAVAAPTADTPTQSPTVAPNEAFEERKARASQISKSPAVSRFGGRLPQTVSKKQLDHVPVIEPPKDAPVAQKLPSAYSPAPAAPVSVPSTPVAPANSSAISFSAAIANATSHEQPALAKPKLSQRTAKKLGTTTKLLTTGGIAVALFAIVGFFAYQQVPAIQVQIASAKAGFSASLPGYTPSGFSIDSRITSSNGEVTVNYRSNSDERNFQVTQKPSNWTSESLRANYVATDNRAYQTYEDRGKTVFMYDNGSATWVNGGVWYEIKGNSSLSTDQVLHIVNSF